MYRNNVLNIKVVVTSDTKVQDKIIYKKDLLKLQKNFKKYLKVTPQINVLFKDVLTTNNRQSSTAITDFYETGMIIRILAKTDVETELMAYDIDISSTYIGISIQKLN